MRTKMPLNRDDPQPTRRLARRHFAPQTSSVDPYSPAEPFQWITTMADVDSMVTTGTRQVAPETGDKVNRVDLALPVFQGHFSNPLRSNSSCALSDLSAGKFSCSLFAMIQSASRSKLVVTSTVGSQPVSRVSAALEPMQ